MAVALVTGISPGQWLDDPRALFTAVELLAEMNKKRARGRHS